MQCLLEVINIRLSIHQYSQKRMQLKAGVISRPFSERLRTELLTSGVLSWFITASAVCGLTSLEALEIVLGGLYLTPLWLNSGLHRAPHPSQGEMIRKLARQEREERGVIDVRVHSCSVPSKVLYATKWKTWFISPPWSKGICAYPCESLTVSDSNVEINVWLP